MIYTHKQFMFYVFTYIMIIIIMNKKKIKCILISKIIIIIIIITNSINYTLKNKFINVSM